jgi:hypothetical protein
MTKEQEVQNRMKGIASVMKEEKKEKDTKDIEGVKNVILLLYAEIDKEDKAIESEKDAVKQLTRLARNNGRREILNKIWAYVIA